MNHEVLEDLPVSEFRVVAHKQGATSKFSDEFAGAFSDALADILAVEGRTGHTTKG